MNKTKLGIIAMMIGVFGMQGAIIHHLENKVDSQQNKISVMKENNYKFATGKRSMKLENGQFIKTNKFELQYVEHEDGKWSAVIYPTDKNTRILGQQGEGAKGLELDNVSYQDQGLTTIVDK